MTSKVADMPLMENKDGDQLSTKKELSIDEFLEQIGQFGLMQKIYVAIFCLLTVPSTYQSLIMTFIGNNPSWKCVANTTECGLSGSIGKNNENFNKRCNMKRSSWEYTKKNDFSIVTEWDLICKDLYLSYLANSSMFIGWAFSAVLLGWISDRYGRKIILFPSLGLLIVASFAMAFVQNIWLFFVLRLIIGVAKGGIGLTMFVMASELVGSKYRSVAGTTLWIAFTGALCLMALQGWLVPKWRLLLIITSIPFIILMPIYVVIPESLRWLRLNGKVDQAEDILKKLARKNKKPWPNARLSAPVKNEDSVSFKYLFTPRSMIISTFIQGFAWVVIAQVYYGISLASDNLGGSMYRDFVLTSIVELPAYLLVMYTLNRFGRRPAVCGSMIISGISCIGVAFIPTTGAYNWIRVAFGMMGKLCITIAFGGIYVWSVELYPTVIRSQGMAFMIVASRIGAGSAPWVAQYLGFINKYLPFLVMGSLTLISAVTCFKLKETVGVTTPETLEDMFSEGILKSRSYKSWFLAPNYMTDPPHVRL